MKDENEIVDELKDDYMLTTVDNPYDPFTEYENWLAFDEQKGYFTNGLLARLTLDSPELTDEENKRAIDHAVEDIMNLFPGMYRTVRQN